MEEKKRAVAREWIESIVIALILALIIRFFLIEMYKIPSASMEPTLIGDPSPWVQNRIIVFKFPYKYHFIEPKRWDVIVFTYPKNPSLDYIKRLVAFEGEHVQIANGDVFIDGVIAEKPPKVAKSMRIKLYDQDFSSPRQFLVPQDWQTAEGDWQLADGKLVASTATGTTMAYTRPITNAYKRPDGKQLPEKRGVFCDTCNQRYVAEVEMAQQYSVCPNPTCEAPTLTDHTLDPTPRRHLERVSDLMFETDVAGYQDGTTVTITQVKDEYRFEYKLGVGSAPSFLIEHKTGAGAATRIPLPKSLPLEKEVNVGMSFVDGVLRLFFDRQEVYKKDFAFSPDRSPSRREGTFYVAVDRGKVAFDNFRLYRDVYYTNRRTGGSEYNYHNTYVDKDSYYVLGDNSKASEDSRVWKFVPKHFLIGKAILVVWPFSDLKSID